MGNLLTLLVSFCITELIHNAIEIWGIRQKTQWLSLSLRGKEYGKWPINIDTKFKTAILHGLILILITSAAYFLLQFLNLTNEFLVVIGITILLVNYIITTWKVDSLHTELGKLIKSAKKQE